MTENSDDDYNINVHNIQTCSSTELRNDVHLSENVNSSVINLNNKLLRDTNLNLNPSQNITNKKKTFSNVNNLNLGLKRKGMNIGHLNLQGINSKEKISELSLMLNSKDNNIHVLGISETKLNSDTFTYSLEISGYKTPFRKDHLLRNGGGGLLIYLKENIDAIRRYDLECLEIECIILEIKCKNTKPFLICQMYRHPAEKVEWKNRFEKFVENLYNQEREVIIIGDFNRDLLNDQIKNDWLDFTISLGLNQLIIMPTRVNQKSSTLIDHIYTNMPDNITSTCVPNIGISDHHAVFCNRKLNASVPKAIHSTIQYRSYKAFNENDFCNDLKNVCWSHLKDLNEIDSIVLCTVEQIIYEYC